VGGSSSPFRVKIDMDNDGDIHADCECLSLNLSDKLCRHIAAVLLRIYEIRNEADSSAYTGIVQDESPLASSPSPSASLTVDMLGLFSSPAARSRPRSSSALLDNREMLRVEFACVPFPHRNGTLMFGIELKVGLHRMHSVKRIREFLDRLSRGASCAISSSLIYDPASHRMQASDDSVIDKLIEIHLNDTAYLAAGSLYSSRPSLPSEERMLLIPPASWESLLERLAQAPLVRMEHDGFSGEGLQLSEAQLPLRFEVAQIESGDTASESALPRYSLTVQGLDGLKVMALYGAVLSEGRLLSLPTEQAQRLAELQRMLSRARSNRIEIAEEQLEPFLERVIPGLRKLGDVHLSPALSERVVRVPLKAKLYLDRVKDRLLAGLEFHYGDVVLNPLEEDGPRGAYRILLREADKEARIIELMEQSRFLRTESGYFMEDEESQFDFLYHRIPELEKLLQVYATTAVKVRLYKGNPPPRIRIGFDERTNWLDCKFELEGVPEAEIRQLIQALSDKRKYYKLASGALVPLETPDYEAINRFIAVMKVDKGQISGNALHLPAVRGLGLLEDGIEHSAIQLGTSLRTFLESLSNPDTLSYPVPESLAPVLRDYQKHGFQWMKSLAHYRFGGILADDMGLGKSLQSIAFLVSVLADIRREQLPALIVCPASLLYNWRNEISKFAPDIRVSVADGSKAERTRRLRHPADTDILITSYPLLRRDLDSYAQLSFHTLILDEAQAFKNDTTQTARSVKAIKARHRFALTGTPIENAIEELCSIYDAVFPELFQNREAFSELTRDDVARRARPFLLRRLKADVLAELPEKIESVQTSALLPEQKKLYLAYLAKLRKETLKHLDEEGFGKSRIRILAGITRLRQLCCHPALFVEGYEGRSAKLEQLLELLEECRSAGKRVLVFSQFTGMLDLIRRELGSSEVPCFYLDGQTPASERVELCQRFNEGERDLFLISLKAGGTGLNLTGADTVILYDLWWNPAVEQQAADRAHRMGQKNVVQVLRLIAQDTVEEKIYALQQRKKNLIDQVVHSEGPEGMATITEQEVRDILLL
jgi:superfamily II DNA or RNA helicase